MSIFHAKIFLFHFQRTGDDDEYQLDVNRHYIIQSVASNTKLTNHLDFYDWTYDVTTMLTPRTSFHFMKYPAAGNDDLVGKIVLITLVF